MYRFNKIQEEFERIRMNRKMATTYSKGDFDGFKKAIIEGANPFGFMAGIILENAIELSNSDDEQSKIKFENEIKCLQIIADNHTGNNESFHTPFLRKECYFKGIVPYITNYDGFAAVETFCKNEDAKRTLIDTMNRHHLSRIYDPNHITIRETTINPSIFLPRMPAFVAQ